MYNSGMSKISIAVIAIFALLVAAAFWMPPATPSTPADLSEGAMKTYESTDLGISFLYPTNYYITELHAGNGERTHHALILVEDTPGNRDLMEGKMIGESPTGITIDIYQNDLDKYTTESWVRGHGASNFKLSDGMLKETTVSGKPAFRYAWSGLYEADNVAIATDRYIYSFVGTYIAPEDKVRDDFANLMQTVTIR